jgi:glycosyltransferase involved in cell wall biosynthesis
MRWIFDVNWRWLRPCLKRVSPSAVRGTVQWLRSQFQPSFVQHKPIPLRLPNPPPLFDAETLPKIALVTPSFNQGVFLERTILSVLEQRYPQLEYVIQDGGSTDATPAILEQYRPQLTHVESRTDHGQAYAINAGFRRTTGEIMAWLNADDLFLPGALAAVAGFFHTHPEIDVVYGQRICIDLHDQEIGRWLVLEGAERMLPWANYLPQETIFWRRRIWERVGGMVDESYHFAMDWELFLRFYRCGATFARMPVFLGAFRVHPAQKTSHHEQLGIVERQRLQQNDHGRPIDWLEIRYHVRRYLWRVTWGTVLYRSGWRRY